jgi:hypothetical protein
VPDRSSRLAERRRLLPDFVRGRESMARVYRLRLICHGVAENWYSLNQGRAKELSSLHLALLRKPGGMQVTYCPDTL